MLVYSIQRTNSHKSCGFQIFSCQCSHCPCGQKGNCALLVPKHTQGATVNCQVYIITIYTLMQALFFKIHKKIIKAVAVFLYNCSKFHANILVLTLWIFCVILLFWLEGRSWAGLLPKILCSDIHTMYKYKLSEFSDNSENFRALSL